MLFSKFVLLLSMYKVILRIYGYKLGELSLLYNFLVNIIYLKHYFSFNTCRRY